jgi:protein TonB
MSKLALAAPPRRAVVIIAAVVVVVAAAAAFASMHIRHSAAAAASDAGASTSSSGDEAGSSGVDILLGLARQATREGRLVSPQGNNAYEYYLSVVQLDTNNATAQDALRETIPFASQEIERLINRRDLEEARREIALLRDYDPTNYTLIILGAKLDAQQQVVTAEDEAKAEAMRRRNG